MKKLRLTPENQLLLDIRESLERIEKQINEPRVIDRDYLSSHIIRKELAR